MDLHAVHAAMARVNQHPHWYLDLFEWGLLVEILSSKSDRFELIDPDGIVIVFRNNLNEFWGFYQGTNMGGCWFTLGIWHHSHTIPKILLCKTHYSRGCSILPCGLPQFHQILICTKSSRRHIIHINVNAYLKALSFSSLYQI